MADTFFPELTSTEQRRVALCLRVAQSFGIAAAVAGFLMVLLWIVRPGALTPVATLWLWKSNCAMCLAGIGAALAAGQADSGFRLRWRQVLASGVAVFAGLTLLEYATGTSFGIDTLLPANMALKNAGRMAPQTAAASLLFAITLLHLHRREGKGSAIADACIIGSGVLLQSVMSGYLARSTDVLGATTATRMAPQSMIVASLLWAGVICARADRGLCRLISADERGSYVIRWLLPPAILAPAVIGAVRIWAEAAGFQTSPFSISLFATIQGIIRITAIIVLGYLLNRSETLRRDEQVRREKAERMVAMCAWTQRVRWNDEWISIDAFLKRRFGIEVTHGISDEALNEQLATLDLVDMNDHDVRRSAA